MNKRITLVLTVIAALAKPAWRWRQPPTSRRGPCLNPRRSKSGRSPSHRAKVSSCRPSCWRKSRPAPGGRTGFWFEEIPSNRSQAKTCGLVCWTSGEIALFTVRHYLGVRFESGGRLAIRPALYPGDPPVSACLRFHQGRLLLDIDGSGPIKDARVNGVKAKVGADGTLRLPLEFQGGKIEIHTRRN